MNAVDSNILIYADHHRDSRKHRIATELVGSLQDGVLLWQVACEYLNVVRRTRPGSNGLVDGYRRIQDLRQIWRFIEPQEPVIDLAIELLDQYSLSL